MDDFILTRRQQLADAQDFMAANPACNRVGVGVGGLYLDRSGNVSYTPLPEPGSTRVPANAQPAEGAA